MSSKHIVEIPDHFKPIDVMRYPEDNDPPFETYFSMEMDKLETFDSERWYLGICWTAYYKNHSYGADKLALYHLQTFLDGLDRSKKYFTICQYDSGILNDLSKLDIKVFSMAGKPMDYPLPLISQPHSFKLEEKERSIKCCFVGANTHPVRYEIFKLAYQQPDYFISLIKYPLQAYCNILATSVFSLCPRGFSGNSFRVQESLQYGAIPVIISDDFNDPHHLSFFKYGFKIAIDSISRIPDILANIAPETITALQEKGKFYYKELYTFESNRDLILQNL